MALLLRGEALVRHIRAEWPRGLLSGACTLASYSLALWAMTRAPIALVVAVRETSIVFGVAIAAFTLKERVTRARVAAVLLVVVGVILIKTL